MVSQNSRECFVETRLIFVPNRTGLGDERDLLNTNFRFVFRLGGIYLHNPKFRSRDNTLHDEMCSVSNQKEAPIATHLLWIVLRLEFCVNFDMKPSWAWWNAAKLMQLGYLAISCDSNLTSTDERGQQVPSWWKQFTTHQNDLSTQSYNQDPIWHTPWRCWNIIRNTSATRKQECSDDQLLHWCRLDEYFRTVRIR